MSQADQRRRTRCLPRVRPQVQATWCLEDYVYPAGRAERTETHAHSTWQLCLSYNQPGRYRFDGRTLEVPPGSVSLVPPGLVHFAEDTCDRSQPAHYTVLYLRAPQWRFRRHEPVVWEGASVMKTAEALVGQTRRRGLDEAASDWAAALHQWGLSSDSSGDDTAAVAAVERVRARIDRDPAGCHRLEALAAELGWSPSHLCRSFRRAFGLPPHAYVLEARLRLAKTLLARGAPAAVAAVTAGFSDQSHLHRQLRRHSDVTLASYG